jgi:hypothetical protein
MLIKNTKKQRNMQKVKKINDEFEIDFSSSWVDKNAPYISISQVLGLLGEPFDSDAVAEKTYEKNYNNPDSIYYQRTKQEILEMWEAKGAESRKYGQLLDDYIGANLDGTEEDMEMYKLDNDIDSDARLSGLVKSFDQFNEMMTKNYPHIKFVAREKTLYYQCGDFLVKGRFDALLYNELKKKFIVIDWKSSGSIDTEPNKWTKNLLGPAKMFPALNYYTYTMQCDFYKTALLAHYLPPTFTPDDIEIYIVNLPGKPVNGENYYGVHKEAFSYNKMLMDQIFTFGYKKNELLKKKAANPAD